MWYMKIMDLGIYQGIEKIEVDKVIKDYMKIAYSRVAAISIFWQHSLM